MLDVFGLFKVDTLYVVIGLLVITIAAIVLAIVAICKACAPGEEITDEIIDYIQYSVEKGCSMQGMEDSTLQTLNVLRM